MTLDNRVTHKVYIYVRYCPCYRDMLIFRKSEGKNVSRGALSIALFYFREIALVGLTS